VITLSEITQLIEHRRTIKPVDAAGQPNYLDKPISRDLLEQLLQNANWAPTHGLTEPWRFTVFQDTALDDLASKLSELYIAHTPTDRFNQHKHDKIISYVQNTTVAVALGMQRHAGKISAEEEVMAVACAVENLHLSAAAAGLGGFWSTSSIDDLPETRMFFGFCGPEDRCLGIFYLGYPRHPWPSRKKTAPGDVTEKTNWRMTKHEN